MSFWPTQQFLQDAWKVLVLFIIPIGGGIPAGVVLAQKLGFTWRLMLGLYFISDLMLACAFEPLLRFIVKHTRANPKFDKVRAAYAQSMNKMMERFALNPGPFALVMFTFGTDPMTGRSASFLVGYGFLAGWALTILGDMIFFSVLMVSTLWLNSVLGDGTVTAVIIMVVMMAVPALIRKWRERHATVVKTP